MYNTVFLNFFLYRFICGVRDNTGLIRPREDAHPASIRHLDRAVNVCTAFAHQEQQKPSNVVGASHSPLRNLAGAKVRRP